MKKAKDVYELILIRPILNSTTKLQARKRAAAARVKLARHEKATKMSVGDSVDIHDRIDAALKSALCAIEDAEAVRGVMAAHWSPPYRQRVGQ